MSHEVAKEILADYEAHSEPTKDSRPKSAMPTN